MRWPYVRGDLAEKTRDLAVRLAKYQATYPKLCSWVGERIGENRNAAGCLRLVRGSAAGLMGVACGADADPARGAGRPLVATPRGRIWAALTQDGIGLAGRLLRRHRA